jgi:hypothetical protein
MPAAFLTDVHRYANLIESNLLAVPPVFIPTAELNSALQVERGVVYADFLLHPADPPRNTPLDPLLKLATDADLTRLASYAIVDRTGHHRPVYRGLLLYAAFQSFRLAYEKLTGADFGRWEEGLRPWADLLESELTRIDWPSDPPNQIPALLGAAATDAAFMALALHVAGKLYVRDAWTDLASDTFGKIIRCQQPGGAFLTATASDNPETHWYHELVLLHAAASYAVQAEDRTLAASVVRNSTFHHNETQPDHATNQPWALFAFIWNPETRPLADHQLHTATTLTASPLTSLLLADALYCLRLFQG